MPRIPYYTATVNSSYYTSHSTISVQQSHCFQAYTADPMRHTIPHKTLHAMKKSAVGSFVIREVRKAIKVSKPRHNSRTN